MCELTLHINMGELGFRLFTCGNCVWGDQCPDADGEVCDNFYSLTGEEDALDGIVDERAQQQDFYIEWREYCADYNSKGARA